MTMMFNSVLLGFSLYLFVGCTGAPSNSFTDYIEKANQSSTQPKSENKATPQQRTENQSESASTSNESIYKAQIEFSEDEILKGTDRYSHDYKIKVGDCQVAWEVSGSVNEKKFRLNLRYGYPQKCQSFSQQIPLHKKLLTKIFMKHSPKDLTTVNTGSFARIEPDYSWNLVIAKSASSNQDWIDYSKNYPHHKSKKSSNKILTEIAQHHKVYKPLADLFDSFGITIQLSSVEKVFSQRTEKLPFKEKLAASGVQFESSLPYDAGMMHFVVR